MRFLISRRWILFALAVAGLAWAATLLGQWQFHRLDERRADNRRVASNLDQPPVGIDSLLAVGRPVSKKDEWREVVVHGTWDDNHSIVLKYQTRDGAAGVDVVTPLVTTDGAAVLVDRGWLATENNGGTRPDLPATASGPVTVSGWVRRDGSGGSTRITDLSTRAISSRAAAEVLPYDLYGGFVDLHTETPPPAKPLGKTELPDDTSEGPHFFYGLQWWFFGILAVVGFGYLVYDEFRRAREDRPGDRPGDRPEDRPGDSPRDSQRDGSEGAQHATVDGQHGAGDE